MPDSSTSERAQPTSVTTPAPATRITQGSKSSVSKKGAVIGQVARFGNSILPQAARSAQQRCELPTRRQEARATIRDRVPTLPGVYGYLDSAGRLLYVGKSKSLRNRLLSYQSAQPPDPKMARIVRHARGLMWEPISHELLALIREQELITRWRPHLNRMGQPLRRQPIFLRVDEGLAPGVATSRRGRSGSATCFGPIPGTKEVSGAVIALAYAFGLRDCHSKTRMHFGDQLELFPQLRSPGCLRHELGSCLGPCAAGCTREQYAQRVERTLAFLRGEDPKVLAELQQQMFDAAARKAFERAGVLRDRYDRLQWLNRKLETLRRARTEIHGVLPLPGFRRKTVWLILNAGTIETAIGTSDTLDGLESLRHVAQHTALDAIPPTPETMHEVYLQMILMTWFRRHPEDLAAVLPFTAFSSAAMPPISAAAVKQPRSS